MYPKLLVEMSTHGRFATTVSSSASTTTSRHVGQ